MEPMDELALRRQAGKARGRVSVDQVEELRAGMEADFRSMGFTISVLRPKVSKNELRQLRRIDIELFYHPPAWVLVSYEAWFKARSQAKKWTVLGSPSKREKAENGYWFLADVSSACERLRRIWEDHTTVVNLFNL